MRCARARKRPNWSHRSMAARLWLATISPSPSLARSSTSSRSRPRSSASSAAPSQKRSESVISSKTSLGTLYWTPTIARSARSRARCAWRRTKSSKAPPGLASKRRAQRAGPRRLGDDDLAAVGLGAQDLALRGRARVPRVAQGEQVAEARAAAAAVLRRQPGDADRADQRVVAVGERLAPSRSSSMSSVSASLPSASIQRWTRVALDAPCPCRGSSELARSSGGVLVRGLDAQQARGTPRAPCGPR